MPAESGVSETLSKCNIKILFMTMVTYKLKNIEREGT